MRHYITTLLLLLTLGVASAANVGKLAENGISSTNTIQMASSVLGLAGNASAIKKFHASKRTVRVTSWAGGGQTPDLNPGRWVVKGDATKWNFFKTGLGGPKTSSKFPFIKRPEKPFVSITQDVPVSRLIPPKTTLKEPFAIIKRLFGQYKLR